MDTLPNVLVNTLSDQNNVRAEAEKQLISFDENSPVEFLCNLTSILCNESFEPFLRSIAAITLKNAISAKNKSEDVKKKERWISIAEEQKIAIKQNLLNILYTQHDNVSKSACQVISKLARIELPDDRWPDLLEYLLNLVTADNKEAKKASLTCIQYLEEEMAEILEDYNQEILSEEQNNKILTTVVQGMRDSDAFVREAACKAFFHSVLFAKKNFENEDERNFILEVVIDTCKDSVLIVQQRSFECLVQIVSEFYIYMQPYMNLIVPLTIQAIQGGCNDIAIPALEFWNSICDKEIQIINNEIKQINQNFMSIVLPYLIPHLLKALIQTDEFEDHDEWTISKSAAICISLSAQVVGDMILSYILSFVEENSKSTQEKKREAAVLAYGCIMEGPKRETLQTIVQQSFSNVCCTMTDSSEDVRDTAAWTVGRIINFDAHLIIPYLGDFNDAKSPISIIIGSLHDTPRVASNGCWIISEIANQLDRGDINIGKKDTIFDNLFSHLCYHLIQTAERPDAGERNLMDAAFNTLSALIQGVGDSCIPFMKQLYEHFLKLLDQSLLIEKTSRVDQYQGLICGCLQVLITRLGSDCLEYADRTWNCLYHIFKSSNGNNLNEDALLTTSALINIMDVHFEKYLEQLLPYLLIGLHRSDDLTACKICIELVGDISRAIKQKFSIFCENIMNKLYIILADHNADRTLKPIIMIAISDIAMAITHNFEIYVSPFMQLLNQAAHTDISMGPKDDIDWIWYICDLRDGVLQAYSGIVYGLKDGGKKHILHTFVNIMLELVKIVVEEEEAFFNYTNLSSAIALTGDLIQVFDTEFIQYVSGLNYINTMIYRGTALTDNEEDINKRDCKEKAIWLHKLIEHYNNKA